LNAKGRVLSSWNSSNDRHISSEVGIGRSNNTNSNSRSSVSERLRAIIKIGVNNDSSSENVVDTSIKSKLVIEDTVVVSDSSIIVIEISHISDVKLRTSKRRAGNSVERTRVINGSGKVSSERSSVRKRQISPLVDVESMNGIRRQSTHLSRNIDRSGCNLIESNESRDSRVSCSGLKNADSAGNSSEIRRWKSGIQSSSVVSRIGDSDNSESKSRSR